MPGKVDNDRYLAWDDSRIILEFYERLDDSGSCCSPITKVDYIGLWDAPIMEEITAKVIGVLHGTL